MSEYDIIRAWKDEDYLESLSEEQRSQLPENPAGTVELSDEEMENVAGGGDFNNFSFKDCDITQFGGYCSFNFHEGATCK